MCKSAKQTRVRYSLIENSNGQNNSEMVTFITRKIRAGTNCYQFVETLLMCAVFKSVNYRLLIAIQHVVSTTFAACRQSLSSETHRHAPTTSSRHPLDPP